MYYPNIRALREDRDLKQRELAALLGMAQNTYSQYENGVIEWTAPLLVKLADYYGVSVDYLVKDHMAEREQAAGNSADTARLEQKLDALASDYRGSWGPYYRYTSKTRLLGLPLVSIRFGRDRHPSQNSLAVGVIAIGNFSVGVVSIGLISAGVFSLGMIAAGAMALGMVSIGWAAAGVSVVGVHAAGMAVSKLL